jgi:hypothetical protein
MGRHAARTARERLPAPIRCCIRLAAGLAERAEGSRLDVNGFVIAQYDGYGRRLRKPDG